MKAKQEVKEVEQPLDLVGCMIEKITKVDELDVIVQDLFLQGLLLEG